MKFQCYVSTMPQVSDFPAEQLLVAVFPGVPTAAELFLLPNKNQSEDKKKSEEELEQVWPWTCTSHWGKKPKDIIRKHAVCAFCRFPT